MQITPEMMRGAYEYLRQTPPFNQWKLPPGREVKFFVMKTKRYQALYSRYRHTNQHLIEVSGTRCSHTITLINLISHEMIHMYQALKGTEPPVAQHNAEYYELTKLVCEEHGFDPKNFCP